MKAIRHVFFAIFDVLHIINEVPLFILFCASFISSMTSKLNKEMIDMILFVLDKKLKVQILGITYLLDAIFIKLFDTLIIDKNIFQIRCYECALDLKLNSFLHMLFEKYLLIPREIQFF